MQDADHNVNLEEPETLNEVRLRGSDGKPEGFPVELADAVIRQVIKDKLARIADLCGQLDIDLEQVIKDKLTRIADLCGRLDIDIEQVIKDKLAYNKTRPHMHGRTC